MKQLFLFFLIVLFATVEAPAQCAMCKAVVENGDSTMGESLNTGITYLMMFPYLLVGVLAFFLYRHKKKIKN